MPIVDLLRLAELLVLLAGAWVTIAALKAPEPRDARAPVLTLVAFALFYAVKSTLAPPRPFSGDGVARAAYLTILVAHILGVTLALCAGGALFNARRRGRGAASIAWWRLHFLRLWGVACLAGSVAGIWLHAAPR